MFNDQTKSPLNLTDHLETLNNANQIQQIKSVGNQPRPASLSPNTISDTNARSLSTPKHVYNVHSRLVSTSDVSSKVTVTFKRDPADYFYSKAIVYVSGYKANPAPVQVASGDSPISFALENTGEAVSITVQASGNLGPAPLQTAPNTTLKLRSTPLATTATASGNGTGGTDDDTTADGLLHGSSVWESDPGYTLIRDDFVGYHNSAYAGSQITDIGELGWSIIGSAITAARVEGGYPPYLGQICWQNSVTSNNYNALVLNSLNNNTAYSYQAQALLDYPGWKMTWVWKHDSVISGTATAPSFAKKAFYIGLMGPATNAVAAVNTARPDVFIGIRYDTSTSPGALTLSAAATASGGNTAYTGTITNGQTNAFIGMSFVVTGFTNSANNGTFTCVANSTTTLTLANPSGVSETHAGTATGPSGLGDATYKFEAVTNATWSTGARHNRSGQVVDTGVTPQAGVWHRLDITCSTAGVVTLALNGTTTTTFTISPVSITNFASFGADSFSNKGDLRYGSVGSGGSPPGTPYPYWCSGSKLTFSGFTGSPSAWNGNTYVCTGVTNNPNIYFTTTGVSDFSGATVSAGTISGLPALTPVCVHGNDDTASPLTNLEIFVDFFSLVWNPNLTASGGTADATKARYW